MIVRSCQSCPFFQSSPLGAMLSALAPISRGFCGYRSSDDSLATIELGMPPGPRRDAMIERALARPHVPDASVVPALCPLREHDVIVTLGTPGKTS